MKSPSTQQLVKTNFSQDLENWMTNLPESLKTVPIILLAIPGSHDSFTANITPDSDLSPDAEPILQYLSCFGPCVKYFIANWSRTQTYMATQQLNCGIRYFDLRLATKEGTENFYFVHGLYSENVSTVFAEIKTFLDSHPGEMIILDCQHFYAFTQDDHNRFMALITKTFETKLLPYSEHMETLTLQYMTQCRYQVITIYRSDAMRFGQPFLWPSNSFPNPWPNTVSTTTLFNYLSNGLKYRDKNVGYISQCVLTPDVSFVTMNLFSTLKQKCAVEIEEDRKKWITEQSSGPQGLNVIIGDFIDLNDNEYCKNVINLNNDVLNNYSKKKRMSMPQIHKG